MRLRAGALEVEGVVKAVGRHTVTHTLRDAHLFMNKHIQYISYSSDSQGGKKIKPNRITDAS